jgi:hypothetical protein
LSPFASCDLIWRYFHLREQCPSRPSIFDLIR